MPFLFELRWHVARLLVQVGQKYGHSSRANIMGHVLLLKRVRLENS